LFGSVLGAFIGQATTTYKISSMETSNNSFDTLGYSQCPYSYLIWADADGYYYAKNGASGAITSNTNPSFLLQDVTNELGDDGGKIFIKRGIYTGSDEVITVNSRIYFEGEAPSEFEGGGLVKFVNLYVSFTSPFTGLGYYRGGVKNIDFECDDNNHDLITVADTGEFELNNVGMYKGNYQLKISGKSHFANIINNRFTHGNVGVYVSGTKDDYSNSPLVGKMDGCVFSSNDACVWIQYAGSWILVKNNYNAAKEQNCYSIKIEDSTNTIIVDSIFEAPNNQNHIYQFTSGGLEPIGTCIDNCFFSGMNNLNYDKSSVYITAGNNPIVSNCIFDNSRSDSAVSLTNINGARIYGNQIINAGVRGIALNNCSNIIMESNIIYNVEYVAYSIAGICFNSACDKVQINNNIISKCPYGILVYTGSEDIHIKGNIVSNCDYAGILDYGLRSIIDSNTCKNNGQIDGNPGIYIVNDYKIIRGNFCYDDQEIKTQTYGIKMDGSVDYSIIEGNNVAGNHLSGISEAGTNNQINNNKGYVTENSGHSSISSGSVSVIVTHGCSYIPDADDITLTPTAATTNHPGLIWVDTIDSASFTVHCTADPGPSGLSFSWSIRRVS